MQVVEKVEKRCADFDESVYGDVLNRNAKEVLKILMDPQALIGCSFSALADQKKLIVPEKCFPLIVTLPRVYDLSPEMMTVTRLGYDSYITYAEQVRAKKGEITRLLINPLIEHLKVIRPNDEFGSLFVVHGGTGTGLELLMLKELGFVNGFGFDISREQMKRGDPGGGPFVEMRLEEMGIAAGKVDIFLIESALRHTSWEQTKGILSFVQKSLTEKGIAMVAFRLGSGEVLATVDKIDGEQCVRYSNTCSRKQAEELCRNAGFGLMEIKENPHMQKGVPSWITLFLEK
jgi:hypothetical protein